MKLNIVTRTQKEPQYVVKAGWSNYNGLKNKDYLDFERDVFSIPDATCTDSTIYIQEIVSFHATKCDGDFDEAYAFIRQNNPDGDHNESSSHPITVATAIAMCLEELK